ncbi:MAG: TonB-dependent siderophore receptor [Sphingosinicella sp.]|nr:TonB-dependent siderophore receptor [Sphingosinicella sp.]
MTVHDRTLKTLLLAGAALTGFTTLPAMAQETAPTGASLETTRTTVGGEEMIVVTARNYVPEGSATASKTDIPLIETPQSISVVTRDQIDLLNFIDAQQAVRYTAGVFGENYGPDLRFDFFTVRGFTPKQYIDGLAAPISTSIYSVGVDLYAFESLDLLKGPASVLYGNAPPGGIYNQVSRRAQSALGGEISAKYGEDDYKQIAGTVTGPIADSVDARITALYRDRDSERDFVSARRFTVAPTFTWRIGERTTITGLGYYQYDKVKGDTNGFLPVYGTLLDNPVGKVKRSTNLGDPANVYERKQFALGWDAEHEFSDSLKFRSNVKWSDYKEDTPTGIYGGGGLIETTDPLDPDYYRTVQQYNFSYKEKVTSFATDNRIDANFGTGGAEHKLLVGVDYRNVYNKADFGFIFANTIDLFDPVYAPQATYEPGYPSAFNNQRLKQTGVYAQDQIGFGNFYLTFGGRYDWVKVASALTATTSKQDKFTWRVGANYVSDSGFAPYISYATSFEPVLGVDSVTGDDFKPSTGKQIEAGIKYDARGLPDDVKLFVTAAVFDIKQKNVVSTSPSVTPVFGTQSGEVEVWGGEIELVARIREQISINGSYSYNNSEVKESNFAGEVGAPLPTTPKHKLSLFVDYTIQQGSLGGLGFGFGGRYNSKSAGSLPGLFNPVVYNGESTTLFDAIIHYDTPEWRFAINGSNIFDKTYVARCSGPAGCNFGAGRQVIGTVTRKF